MASEFGAGGGTGANSSSDVQTMTQQFEQAVNRAIQKTGLVEAIRSGNTG